MVSGNTEKSIYIFKKKKTLPITGRVFVVCIPNYLLD